jgi:hypothetical protein
MHATDPARSAYLISFGIEIREYGRRDPSRWPRGTLYPQKLALTSPTSGSRRMWRPILGLCHSLMFALTSNFIYVMQEYSLQYFAFKHPKSMLSDIKREEHISIFIF